MTPKTQRQKKFAKEVKKALIDREMTVGRLADQLGYHRTTVSFAINGIMNLPPCRLAVAKALHLDKALAK